MPWTALGAAAAAGINYLSQRQANKDNVALARLQNQWNLEQWQRENEYNLPTNQVARLKAAGLNPNLAFANGSMMNEAASSPSMVSGAGMVRPYQLDPLTAAQVTNIAADTILKKAQAGSAGKDIEAKEIANQVGRMNADAFKAAYNEGLVTDAVKAGFKSDISSSRLSQYDMLSAAWDFAKITGLTLEQSLSTTAGRTISFGDMVYDASDVGRLFSEYFNESAFERDKSLYVSGQLAQTEANNAAKKIAQLQQQEKDKDFDIWKSLNDAADNGELWAKIARVGLWIFSQQFHTPSFNLSIDRSKSFDQSDRSKTTLKN